MIVNHSQLRAALEKKLAPAYVVAGEELLLVQESLDLIRAAARQRGFAEREILDAERGFDWTRLSDTCNAMSLFAEQRIVELRISSAPDAAGAAAISNVAKHLPRDVLLIVSAGKLDSKQRKSGWFAALDAAGVSLYLDPLKPEQMPAWIEARLRATGLKAAPEAIGRLAQLTEGNVLAAAQEVSKLGLLHAKDSVLTLEDIESEVSDSAHYEAFGWLDKVLSGDARGAVHALEGMRGEGIEIPQIIGALSFDLRKLILASTAFARSHNAQAAVEAANIFPRSRQAAFARAAARVRPAQARDGLRMCARIDALSKSTHGRASAWEELLTWTLTASGAVPSGVAMAGA